MMHHALSRRSLLGAAVAVPAAGWLAGCAGDRPAAQAEPYPDELTYLTSFNEFGRDSYAHLAAGGGHFAQQGLSVRVEPGTGTETNVAALLAGQAQFAVMDLAGAAITRVAQDGFVAIAAVHQRQLSALMTYEDSGIAAPQDLPGRRVGIVEGIATGLLMPAYLTAAGVDVDEVELVPMGGGDLVPALVSGRVDAVPQFVVGRPLLAAAGGGREVVVMPYAEYLDDLYGVGLFTTTELAGEQPQLCAQFRDGLLDGLQAGLDDPDAAGAALAAQVPETNPEVAAAEMALMAPYCQPPAGQALGHLDEARLVRHIALLHAAGLLGPNPQLEVTDLAELTLAPGGAR